MANKLTPSQTLLGLFATLAFCYLGTALVWKWPDHSTWFASGALLVVALFLFFVYRATRKQERHDQ